MSKRTHRVATTLDAQERLQLQAVRRYVYGYTGIKSDAEALRYLVRAWENPDGVPLRKKNEKTTKRRSKR